MVMKIIKPQQSFNCFELASTASLAALVWILLMISVINIDESSYQTHSPWIFSADQ